jgi:hypothetical protein
MRGSIYEPPEFFVSTDYVGEDYRFEIPAQSVERPLEPGQLVKGDKRFELLIRPRGSQDLTAADLLRADFIFIDGDHGARAVNHDSMLAFQLIKSGGIIAWHDYNNQSVSVTRVLDHLHDSAGWNINHIENSWLAFEAFR